ncbi:MAG TPA: ATP-binding cassette domain-containing protein [Trebonia sp.]|nr:ATP-binding cassette domain-containing protein [Trebonia sp.]
MNAPFASRPDTAARVAETRVSSQTRRAGTLGRADRNPGLGPADPRRTGLLADRGVPRHQQLAGPPRVLRIGRAPANDVVIPDLSVSWEHAELHDLGDGRYAIIDLGSHNGTYVNGRRVDRAWVSGRDVIGIGPTSFRLAGEELLGSVDDGDISLAAEDLTVELPDGRVLLDHVTLPAAKRSLVAILGPSGAGKSTLLAALTGTRPATSGTVRCEGRDLYAEYAELRQRIGLVPQENVLHGQLSAQRALRYAAGLRFPGDTSAAERRNRVDEVLGELGLKAYARTRAAALSGGQQKRVNVGLELLTRPSLLFLDEPTSGLDPGSTKSVWEMMRTLADDGRTVIVVTHEVAHLDLCDRVLMLVPLLNSDGDVIAGGRMAYYGPPADGPGFFGESDWVAVFEAIGTETTRDWAAEFAESRYYEYYVAGSLSQASQVSRQTDPQDGPEAAGRRPPRAARGRAGQFLTLTSRYLAVIAADPVYLTYMALLPLVLGLTVRILSNSQGLAGVMHANSNAQLVLLILALAAALNGTSSSIQELIKERAIYLRERAAGLSPGAYLCSKLAVLGTITTLQSAVLILVGLAARPQPPDGAVLRSAVFGIPPALIEIWIATALLSAVSMALGLLISAVAHTTETVFQLLVGITLAQVVMSGGARQFTGLFLLNRASYAFPSRWGYAANAVTVDLGHIGTGLMPDAWWTPTSHTWFRDLAVLAAIGLIAILCTLVKLIRSRPGRTR